MSAISHHSRPKNSQLTTYTRVKMSRLKRQRRSTSVVNRSLR